MQTKKLFSFENLKSFRHDVHKHAELSFKEHRTSQKIIEYLTSLGVPSQNIRQCAVPGLVVDVTGTAPPSGKPFCIALRADMDALPIKEENPEIEYQSVTEAAHMCGHDMHVTCALGGISLVLEKLDQIPSDKKVRLLFQPAEETVGGALPMIKEGAMEGVDEVYGMHNVPWDPPGKMYVKKGYMSAYVSDIELHILGRGGVSSIIEELKDPLQPAADIIVGLRGLTKEYRDKGEMFTVSLPSIRTTDAPNAIADTCVMKGCLRNFREEFTYEFCARLKTFFEEICGKYGCGTKIQIDYGYPPIFNTEKETEIVMSLGKEVLGDGNVVEDDRLPDYGGEDFSYFVKEKPGCFFYLSSAKKPDDELHNNRFDANDEMIPKASEFWLKLVENRFGLSFKDA